MMSVKKKYDIVPSMAEMDHFIEGLNEDKQFLRCLTHHETIPSQEGQYLPLPDDLHPQLIEALHQKGIHKLYTHQAECYQSVRQKDNIVVVTPTASGKTLCYNLPILQSLLEDIHSKALYLFPTKALSQDQQSALNELVLPSGLPIKIVTYDGDTPSSLRISARDQGRIIVTNPDMLHSGILPNHPKWIAFLKTLKYIVIDEVHTYRGVFGSHMTNLIRRLKRILAFYGATPQFILCSATIGNPLELAKQLLEEPLTLIDRNGAPHGEKHILLYNPPVVDSVQGIRRGVVLESQKWALRFLKSGIKTIVFAKSRVRTELIRSYINQNLANHFNENNRITVESYRGGYLPNERRSIEKGLREGTIQGVVSTNALELGIDIGGLDGAIIAGMPSTVASAWQQSGRAGRSRNTSISLFIATSGPRDQYLISHPEYFLEKPPESAYVDPDNPYILMDHLKCASFELPFAKGEAFGGDVQELLVYLESEGVLRNTQDRYYWADRGYPAETVSLRAITNENVVIIDETKGRYEIIGEMDKSSAKELLHDNAIYIHRGNQFVVKHLDLLNLKCHIEASQVNYYTDSVVKTDIKVLSEDEKNDYSLYQSILGDVLVRRQVAKYKKLRYNTHENLGYGEIFLPEDEMHTRACMIVFHSSTIMGMAFNQWPMDEQGAVLRRIGNLLAQTIPIFLMCDSGDIRVSERVNDPHYDCPTIYLYDNYPGGVGLAEQVPQKLTRILQASQEVINNCTCEKGCPSCVGPESSDDPEISKSLDNSNLNYKDRTRALIDQWFKHG
ncbi:DEAD/DEAH box helicase [Spirochaeta cellobiosiphila]|uniref:DEAD/DEAH box helicase n=1 Tax=Spirochaeta cellobiosiphila TaxID=504483 RepID=UPI000A0660A6|nr:DEAD/DEAH box helicase [Spirochaeta cellobiosiphila]